MALSVAVSKCLVGVAAAAPQRDGCARDRAADRAQSILDLDVAHRHLDAGRRVLSCRRVGGVVSAALADRNGFMNAENARAHGQTDG